MITILYQLLKESPARSCWDRGVKAYAEELLENVERKSDIDNIRLFEKALLNGATSWYEYSWGGCSFIYDEDIAKRLCTPSEYKRKDGGRLSPNSQESWHDTQARALYQAARLLKNLYKEAEEGDVEKC